MFKRLFADRGGLAGNNIKNSTVNVGADVASLLNRIEKLSGDVREKELLQKEGQAEIQRLSAALDVNEKTIFGFLRILGEQHPGQNEIEATFLKIAERPKELTDRLQALPPSNDDPDIISLREQATKAIEDANYDQADDLLERVEAIVRPTILERRDASKAVGSISGGDDRLSQVITSFEALFAASEKAAAGNNPAARRIRDSLRDCLDDLRCCDGDFQILATLPSHLAGLAQDIDEHLLGRHFEAMPAAEVLRKLEALTTVAGDAGEHRIDTLDHDDLVAQLKAAIGQALVELPGAGLESNVTKIANDELRHLRREVGKPSFDTAVVSKRRRRLEDLKVNLLERTTLLTESLLAEGFPFLPTGTVFRHVPEIWCPQLVMIPAGTFLMGSPESEPRREYGETQHEVTISKAFGLGRYPVTFIEYDHFCEQTSHEKPYVDDLGEAAVPWSMSATTIHWPIATGSAKRRSGNIIFRARHNGNTLVGQGQRRPTRLVMR